jgi:hypothetical protein
MQNIEVRRRAHSLDCSKPQNALIPLLLLVEFRDQCGGVVRKKL